MNERDLPGAPPLAPAEEEQRREIEDFLADVKPQVCDLTADPDCEACQ